MVVGTLGLPVSPDEPCPFADVEDGGGSEDPLYPSRYVAVCADRGTTLGKTATSFDPYGHLTKAPLITMVARAADLVEPPADYAAPFDDFSQEHYPWARKAAYAGLLDGLSGANGPNFDFWEEAARGELCLLLYNLPAIM